jgi:hypothetical protein
VCGYLFPDGVAGLAVACRHRALSCHYAVLRADPGTCWERAVARGERRWPLEFEPFAKVHARLSQLDLDDKHVIDATGSPSAVSEAALAAFRAGELALADQPPTKRRCGLFDIRRIAATSVIVRNSSQISL